MDERWSFRKMIAFSLSVSVLLWSLIIYGFVTIIGLAG